MPIANMLINLFLFNAGQVFQIRIKTYLRGESIVTHLHPHIYLNYQFHDTHPLK